MMLVVWGAIPNTYASCVSERDAVAMQKAKKGEKYSLLHLLPLPFAVIFPLSFVYSFSSPVVVLHYAYIQMPIFDKHNNIFCFASAATVEKWNRVQNVNNRMKWMHMRKRVAQ